MAIYYRAIKSQSYLWSINAHRVDSVKSSHRVWITPNFPICHSNESSHINSYDRNPPTAIHVHYQLSDDSLQYNLIRSICSCVPSRGGDEKGNENVFPTIPATFLWVWYSTVSCTATPIAIPNTFSFPFSSPQHALFLCWDSARKTWKCRSDRITLDWIESSDTWCWPVNQGCCARLHGKHCWRDVMPVPEARQSLDAAWSVDEQHSMRAMTRPGSISSGAQRTLTFPENPAFPIGKP